METISNLFSCTEIFNMNGKSTRRAFAVTDNFYGKIDEMENQSVVLRRESVESSTSCQWNLTAK